MIRQCLIISYLLACPVDFPVGGVPSGHTYLGWPTGQGKLTNCWLVNELWGLSHPLHSGRQSHRLPQLPSQSWAVKYGPHKEDRRELDPLGPVGVRPEGWPPRRREGVGFLLPWGVFGNSPAWPPNGDQTGAEGWFLPPFSPSFPPFFTTPRSPPIAGGVDQFTYENHIKLKKCGQNARPNSGLIRPCKRGVLTPLVGGLSRPLKGQRQSHRRAYPSRPV